MGAAAGKLQSEKARRAEQLVRAVESLSRRHPESFGGDGDPLGQDPELFSKRVQCIADSAIDTPEKGKKGNDVLI